MYIYIYISFFSRSVAPTRICNQIALTQAASVHKALSPSQPWPWAQGLPDAGPRALGPEGPRNPKCPS